MGSPTRPADPSTSQPTVGKKLTTNQLPPPTQRSKKRNKNQCKEAKKLKKAADPSTSPTTGVKEVNYQPGKKEKKTTADPSTSPLAKKLTTTRPTIQAKK